MSRLSPTTPNINHEQLLRLREVLDLTALSRATVYREISAGNFPEPIKIAGSSRWPASEIARYIEDRKAARTNGTKGAAHHGA